MNAIVFDIGGTTTRLATTDGRRLISLAAYPTPQQFEAGMKRLRDCASRLRGSGSLDRIIGGIAAPLDARHQRTLMPANLPGWHQRPLVQRLQRLFQVPVRLENDAALGGVGEARYGAGKKYGTVAYLTIGTGFGGARIFRGRIDQAALCVEPGNMMITYGGKIKTIESVVSGRGINRTYGIAPEQLRRVQAWREIEQIVALGLMNVTSLWSPEIIILGGSVGQSRRLSLARVRHPLRQWNVKFFTLPRIVRGRLGDFAGLWGSMALLNEG